MKRVVLFCLMALMLIAALLAAPSAAFASDRPTAMDCLGCCENQPDDCAANFAACARICAAAIMPAEFGTNLYWSDQLQGHPSAKPLAAYSSKPVPPPPRSAVHLFEMQYNSGE